MNLKERFGISELPETKSEKCALYKAVMKVVNADGIVTEEEKEFLIDLACQLKMDAEMMTVAYDMSQEEMTQNISAEYVALLEKAAEADGHYDSVEKNIIDQIKNWKLS